MRNFFRGRMGEYHYGAHTWIGHKALQCVYAFATVVCNMPTAVLLLLAAYAVYMFQKKGFSLYRIVTAASIIVIAIFACMDQPSDPRYFGVMIFLICLCAVVELSNYLLFEYDGRKPKEIIIKRAVAAAIVWTIEIIAYAPNVKIFAPAWCQHSEEWNTTVRLGHWNAGEAMSWGEEIALAGRQINRLAAETGANPNDITIYTNYGGYWIKNPGYRVTNSIDASMLFDDNLYFVLTKKMTFPDDVASGILI